MPTDFPHNLASRFIVFDGPDGSGKSTQFSRLRTLAQESNMEVLDIREPGGTTVGERIRSLLLDPAVEEYHPMDVRCEMLLYMASRAQLVAEKIRPARDRGALILADRFIASTLAYQGTAGGLDPKLIYDAAHIALQDCWPDLTVVFDVDQDTAAKRLNPLLDRMEQKGADYHARVRQGYLDQAQQHPNHYRVIDARPDADTVTTTLYTALQKLFT